MTDTLALSLRVTNSHAGTTLDRVFTRFPVRIGRSSLNDLRLDFEYVSHFHALLEKADETILLRDLGSRNGTSADAKRLPPHHPIDVRTMNWTFDIGPIHVQMATSMVPKSPQAEQTEVMLAIQEENPAATQVWQAFVGVQSDRDPRDVALKGLKHLARAYVPTAGPLDDVESVQRFLGKIKASLDVLYGGYVPLRDGSKQVQIQLDMHSGRRSSDGAADAVSAAKGPAEVARLALDWRDPTNDVVRAIQSAFADFVIHQLALFDGVLSGVRALLRELSPKTIEAMMNQRGAPLFGKATALWKLYAQRHGDLAEEESQAFALIFGRDFVRAYKSFSADPAREREHSPAQRSTLP